MSPSPRPLGAIAIAAAACVALTLRLLTDPQPPAGFLAVAVGVHRLIPTAAPSHARYPSRQASNGAARPAGASVGSLHHAVPAYQPAPIAVILAAAPLLLALLTLAALALRRRPVVPEAPLRWVAVATGASGRPWGRGGLPVQRRGPWTCARPTTPELAERVTELLARREAHQANQEYAEADTLEAEVKALGVDLDERRRLWVDRSLPWVQAPTDPAKAAPELVATVTEALRRRDALNAANDKEGSRAIGKELLDKGIRLDNGYRTWTTADPRTGAAAPSGAPAKKRRLWRSARPTGAELTKKVTELLAQRDRLLDTNEMAKAVAISEELKAMGIRWDPRRREWVDRSVPWERAATDPGPASRELLATVTEALPRRDALLAQSDAEGARAVEEGLRAQGIRLDDGRRTWTATRAAAATAAANPSPAGPPAPPPSPAPSVAPGKQRRPWRSARQTNAELTAKVTALLAKRDQHQTNKEYTEADAIRVELEAMGVGLNPRRREWIDRSLPWERAPRDKEAVAPEFAEAVTEALRRRDGLFAANDTDGAKAVAEELRAKGVRLFDGRRTWTTATAPPAPAAAPSPSPPPPPPPSPEPRRQERRPWTCVRPTGAGLTTQVNSLLAERDVHLAHKEAEPAAAISQQLRGMGIRWDWRRRIWIDRSVPWERAPGDPEPAAPGLVATVTEALRRYDALSSANDNDGVGAVAQELRGRGVRLDANRRTWTTAPAREPPTPGSGSPATIVR